jgi:hypothetical protein
MKIREAITEMDMGRGAKMNYRNATRRRKLEENDRMETKNGVSRKEEGGKKIRRQKKDENSEIQKEIAKVNTKQRDSQNEGTREKSKIKKRRKEEKKMKEKTVRRAR